VKNHYRVVLEDERKVYGHAGNEELVVPEKTQDVISQNIAVSEDGTLAFDDGEYPIAVFAKGYWLRFYIVVHDINATAEKREIKAGAWA
jgi:hypothetical protein